MKNKTTLFLLAAVMMVCCACSTSTIDKSVEETAKEVVEEAKGEKAPESEEASKEEAGTSDTAKAPDAKADEAADIQAITESFIEKAAQAAGTSPENAKYSLVDDLDKDGSFEGFIFIGDGPDEEGIYNGTIWFVNDSSCEKLHDEWGYIVSAEGLFDAYDLGDRKFITFDEYYVTANVTCIYYVEGPECRESAISRAGGFYPRRAGAGYCISDSEYDMNCSYEEGKEAEALWTGHTWKAYYVYYDEEAGDFREYGGKAIEEKQLADICGFDLAEEIRAEGYQVGDIFERGNGIVNVNYSKETREADGSVSIDYMNASFDKEAGEFIDVWDTHENTWKNSDYGGIYKEALVPEAAVY